MAVQSELDLSRERKQVDDLTAAFERLQLGAVKTNRTNLSALEAQVDALASGASGSLKRMLTDLKGNLQELDGMLQGSGRKIAASWATVAADTLARVNAGMSKVNAAYATKLAEQEQKAKTSATRLLQIEEAKEASLAAIEAKAARRASNRQYDLAAGANDKARLQAALFEMSTRPQTLSLYDRTTSAQALADAAKSDALQTAEKVKQLNLRIQAIKRGAAEELLQQEKQLQVDRWFAGAQQKNSAEALADKLSSLNLRIQAIKRGAAEELLQQEKQLQVDRWFDDAQNKQEKAAYASRIANLNAHIAKVNALRLSESMAPIGNTGRTLGGAEVVGSYTSYDALKAARAKPAELLSSSIKPTDIKNVNDLSTAFRKLSIDGNDVHSAMRGLASGFNLLWLTWGNLAPLFAGASLSFGVTKTFEIGSEVEHNIKMLEVLGDKTKEQGSVIREELRKIDQTTLFSLKELSKTMVDLEQAGISGAEGLRLLKVSADLAAVGNTNLGVTSTLLTQTLGAFPETAADITRAAAQMFKTTKDGKLNIEDISESIKYAATANLLYGQSLEDTLVALKAMASVGIKESMAGTGFANLLQDLTGRTGPARKALAEMEKALGHTIKAFDVKGKARPFLDVVNDIQEALSKFKPDAAMELVNKAFSERGLRAMFSAIAQGTLDLKSYKAELQNVDPSMLGKSAAAIMDTTKGAMDRLRGELVGLLDRTFESMDSRFKDSINRLTGLIGSSEFSTLMRGMVSGVVALGEAAVQYLPTLLKLGTAFVAFKAMNMLQPMLMGVASALAGLISFLTLGTTQMGRMAGSAVASATNVGALGTNMIVTAASSRAAAAGLGIVQVEAAGAAAKLTVAAGAGRAAAVVLGFLANPIVGTIATLGLLAYTFSSVSKSSQSASEELSSKIYKDGKVNIDILNKEIAKINERNAVAASGAKQTVFDPSVEDAKSKYQGAADNYLKVQRIVAEASEKDISDVAKKGLQSRLAAAKEAQERTYDNWHALHFARQKVLDNSEKLEAAAEAKRMRGVQASQKAAELAARRATSGLDLSGDAKSGKFARGHITAIKQVKDNLESIASSSQAAVAQLTDTYNIERDVLKNRHSNLLIDEGTYQAQSLAQIQAYETEKLRLLEAKDEAGRAEAYRVYVANSEILQKQLAQAKGTADEQLTYRTEKEKEFAEEVNRVGEKLRSDLANSETERVKLHNEAFKRMTIAAQDYEGVVKKLDLQTDDEIRAIRLKREEADATANLARQYDGVTTSSMAYLQAQKAAALASAAAQAEAQKHLETVDKAIKLAEQAAESFKGFASGTGMLLMPEVMAAYSAQLQEIEALRRNRAKYSAEATTDIAAAGKRAFDNVIAEDVQRLKSGTADAIMTGLFEGGKAGKASLRKLIVDELKKPIRLVVDAFVNTVFGSMAGGAGSAAGSAAGSMLTSAAGNYVTGALGAGLFGSAGAYASGLGMASSAAGSQAAMLAAQTAEFGASGLALTAQAAGTTGTAVASAASASSAIMSAIPYVAAFVAAAALIESLDDSGTYHSGGAAQWSAAGGTQLSNDIDPFGLGLAKTDFSQGGSDMAKGFAMSVGGMLDSVAVNFGKKAGYSVATAFADDTSKDGAWGGLLIKDQAGNNVVNWNDSRTSRWASREFADGEAGAREYAAAVAKDVRDYLITQTPDWADVMLNALGDSPTIETLATTVANINATASALTYMGKASAAFAAMGEDATSRLVAGLGGAKDAGQTLSSYYMDYYSESERTALATEDLRTKFAALGKEMPASSDGLRAMVDAAIAAGDTKLAADIIKLGGEYKAVNAAAEERIKSLKDEADNLNVELLKSQGRAAEALSAQRAIDIKGMNAAAIAQYDLNQARKQEIRTLNQRTDLEKVLLQKTGNTARLRELELQSIEPSNRGLQLQIWAYEDQKDAQDAATAALAANAEAQKKAADDYAEAQQKAADAYAEAQRKYLESWAEAESFLRDLTGSIRSYLDDLNAEVSVQGYNSAAAAFSAQMVLARGGDRDAIGGITGYATTLLEAINRESDTAEEARLRSGRVRGQLASLPSQLKPEQLIVNAINTSTQALLSGYNTASYSIVTSLGTGFDRLDTSMDGMLNIAEFSSAMAGKATDAELSRLFDLIDVDNDHLISKLEAQTAATTTIGQQIKASLANDFAKLDTNLSQGLDIGEFTSAFQGLATEDSLRAIFHELDVNGDGQISKLEAIKASSGETASNTYGLDKLARISDVINSLQWGTPERDAVSVSALATIANQQGWTADDMSKALGRFSGPEIADFFAKYGRSITVGGLGGAAGGTASTGIGLNPPTSKSGVGGFSVGGGGGGASSTSSTAKYYGSLGTPIFDATTVDRLDSINGYINTLDWGAGASASAWAMYQNAGPYDVTQAEIAVAAGMPLAAIQELFDGAGVPRFAKGGMHSGGIRLVGEDGPELEVTGPARIYNAADTVSMLGSRNDDELIAELRALRESNDELRAENRAQALALVQANQRMAKIFERWDNNGIPEQRVVA